MKFPKAALLIAFLLALLYARTILWLVTSWLSDPYYSHGFLVLLVSGFFAWLALRTARAQHEPSQEPYRNGIFIFAFGLLLYAAGFLMVFPFLIALSFLFTASGLILYVYGKALMRALLFPLAFLIFAIPLPVEFLDTVGYFLQELSARYPAALLELFGISVIRVGAEIHLADAAFIIGLPCSGMNSLISLLALAALFVYLLRCPWYKKGVLLCSAVPLAIFANILRVTSLLLIANAYGADTASGFYHTLFSPLLFIIALLCLLLVSILIGCKV
jgi:exosortase